MDVEKVLVELTGADPDDEVVPDVEMSVEDGFIEVSLVWEVSLELVSWEDWVVSIELGDKLGELTLEIEVSMAQVFLNFSTMIPL